MESVLKLFALILWYEDEPVKGNVLSLTSVKKPRKDPEQYQVGDVVMASCPGMKGTFSGVIALIGGPDEKGSLISILSDSDKFGQLVSQFGQRSTQENPIPDQIAVPAVESSDRDQPAQKKKKPMKKTGSAKDASRTAKKSVAVSETENIQTLNIEKAANNLELDQLEEAVFAYTALEEPRLETSSILAETLAVLHGTDSHASLFPELPTITPPKPSKCRGCSSMEVTVGNLQQQISASEQRIAGLEGNLNWLWHQHQQLASQMQQNVTKESQHVNRDVDTLQSVPAAEPSLHTAPEEPTQITFNGYTKDQLKAKTAGYLDFSKAAKHLFRSLFKESEWVGRTLTGAKANNMVPSRPKLEDTSGRMNIIYEIIQEKFPGKTISVINGKIAEIMKPSRTLQK